MNGVKIKVYKAVDYDRSIAIWQNKTSQIADCNALDCAYLLPETSATIIFLSFSARFFQPIYSSFDK
ncbi:hypothetical protein VCHA34P116_170061 [Vibrio chagasii]|nr:hypothetical protein VCHA32P90_160061 [Vibrio chagasii]CAH6826015.1 hypothetical protein VCHA34P116_170061 [Vibrio chagasii]CAH6873652.1 hypothetical protein VCHA34P121_20063 [Vibrio chagasii]CAH6913639.1 hypothetical protein VCHA36P166_20356 [Vibrio chagasii]CAH7049553.1 hypothetical protein VCHA35O143_60066 [Vibrio chagasii]